MKWALPASTPVQANTAYEWIFTPDDTANYTELTGQITLYASSGGGDIPTPPVPPTPPTPPTPPMPPVPPRPNPDGSTTETVTKPDGSSVSTTKYPDGSSVSTEVKRDGTTTTVKRDSKGSTIEAVAKPDGSVHTMERRTDGTKVETTSDRYGETYAKVEVPRVGSEAKVTIPTPFKPVPGEVLVIVSPDGTEKVVRKTGSNAEGLTFTADKNVTVKVQSRGKSFHDVPAHHWARDCVAFATARELFNGVSETSFAPNAHMTRGMMAVVLHNLEDAPHSPGEYTFQDVSNGHWSSEAIQWAADKGIVSGYEDGSFGPDDAITREQLAVMLYRYAGSPAVSNRYLGFTDAHKVGGFAQEAVCWAVENGILSGTGNGVLDPTGTATRGQVSMMLMRYIENVQ